MTDPATTDVDEGRADREAIHDVPDDVEPGVAVVEAVAAAAGRDPMTLPPLQRSIDVDAMNALVATADDRLVLSIAYADRIVVIDGDGTVSVGE